MVVAVVRRNHDERRRQPLTTRTTSTSDQDCGDLGSIDDDYGSRAHDVDDDAYNNGDDDDTRYYACKPGPACDAQDDLVFEDVDVNALKRSSPVAPVLWHSISKPIESVCACMNTYACRGPTASIFI